MGELITGQYTYGNPSRRGDGNTVTIGKFCSIAGGVAFDSGFNHNSAFISTYPFHTFRPELPTNIIIKGDTVVGNDVWISEQVMIMSGVTIGDGAVIGMRAIISKDIQPYEIVVGAPQKVLRKRFSDDQIKELLLIKWWDWNIEKIVANAHLLQSNNIDEFINLHKIKPNDNSIYL